MDRKKTLAAVLASLCSISSNALAGGPGERVLKRPRSQSVGGKPRISSSLGGRSARKTGDRKNRSVRSQLLVSGRPNLESTRDRSKSSRTVKDSKGKATVLNQKVPTSESYSFLLKLLLAGSGGLFFGGAGVGIPTYLITKKKNVLPGTPQSTLENQLRINSGINSAFMHALGFINDNVFCSLLNGTNGVSDLSTHLFIQYVNLLSALDSLEFKANLNEKIITCKVKGGFPTTTQTTSGQAETPAAQIAKLKFSFVISGESPIVKLSLNSVGVPEDDDYLRPGYLVWLTSGENCKIETATYDIPNSDNVFLKHAKCVLAKALFKSFMFIIPGNNSSMIDNICKFHDGICIRLLEGTIN